MFGLNSLADLKVASLQSSVQGESEQYGRGWLLCCLQVCNLNKQDNCNADRVTA